MDRLAARSLSEVNEAKYVAIPLPDSTFVPEGFNDDDFNPGKDGNVELFSMEPEEMMDRIFTEDGWSDSK